MIVHTYIQVTPRRLAYYRSFVSFEQADEHMRTVKEFYDRTWHNFQRPDTDTPPDYITR